MTCPNHIIFTNVPAAHICVLKVAVYRIVCSSSGRGGATVGTGIPCFSHHCQNTTRTLTIRDVWDVTSKLLPLQNTLYNFTLGQSRHAHILQALRGHVYRIKNFKRWLHYFSFCNLRQLEPNSVQVLHDMLCQIFGAQFPNWHDLPSCSQIKDN